MIATAATGWERQRGSVLVLTALSMTLLLGVGALALDGGFMFDLRQRLAATADGAALSAAREVHRGNSANITTYAQREVNTAISSGLLPSGISVTTRLCSSGAATCIGAASANANYVEVILSKVQITFLGNLLSIASMTPTARAVAGVSTSRGCIVSLASSGTGIAISNNAEMNALNCEIMANSNAGGAIAVSNNGDINATGGSVGATGTCTTGNNGSITPTCQTSVPPLNDPLSGLPALTPGSGGPVSVGNNGSATINPGTYSSISVANNAALTMNPGRYILTGGLSLSNNATLTGSGILIYSASGGISFSNNAVVTLSAQTSGTYAGVLVYQPASNTAGLNISNNGTFTLSGALYFPGANVSISNNGIASNNCSLIVAQRITLSNNATINPNSTCSAFGGSPIHSVAMAE